MPAVLPPELIAALSLKEEILWWSQPRPYVFMLRGLPAIFYGITWSVLGAFWYHGAGGIGEYSAFEGWWRLIPLGSVPFILCGFSFFFYPISLGARARHTWYVVSNKRIFIARLIKKKLNLRVFTRQEMGPPHVIKRFDGLYEIVLEKGAQNKPYLVPRLESGFFGITNGEAAEHAINTSLGR